MFKWFATRSESKRKARDIYGAVVTQARNPDFYTVYRVSDSPQGRYEMIALHLILALDRLGKPDINDEDLRRRVLETFISDMDDALREFGIGYQSVPKRVRRAADATNARSKAYGAAMADANTEALHAALKEYVYQGAEGMPAAALGDYFARARADLAQQQAQAIRDGRITFPSPGLAP